MYVCIIVLLLHSNQFTSLQKQQPCYTNLRCSTVPGQRISQTPFTQKSYHVTNCILDEISVYVVVTPTNALPPCLTARIHSSMRCSRTDSGREPCPKTTAWKFFMSNRGPKIKQIYGLTILY